MLESYKAASTFFSCIIPVTLKGGLLKFKIAKNPQKGKHDFNVSSTWTIIQNGWEKSIIKIFFFENIRDILLSKSNSSVL